MKRKMARRVLERNRSREERKKTLRAFIISIVVHLLLIILVALAVTFRPPEIVPPEEEPMELTIIEPPKPPAKPPKPSYVDTVSMEPAEKPTENAPFESDRDTRAASQQPAAGNAPVPTQEGVEVPDLEVRNQEHTAGKPTQPAPPPSAPQQAVQASAQTRPQPTPPPVASPSPLPRATPRATAQLALLEAPQPQQSPQPTPEKQTPDQPKQDQKPPAPQANPQPPSAPGYQPQTRITKLKGNITNRGRSSVAANSTPLGRYQKIISDAIGSRWYYYIKERGSLLTTGTLTVSFVVNANGKTANVRVIRNTSNETFAACGVGAIIDAEIPPIPEALLPMLENNRLEFESLSFTLF